MSLFTATKTGQNIGFPPLFSAFQVLQLGEQENHIHLHTDCTTAAAMEPHHKTDLTVCLNELTSRLDVSMNSYVVPCDTRFYLQKQ